MTDSIRIDGLRDFQRDLRAVDKDLPKELRKANLAAAEIVAKGATAKAASLGGVAAKAAPSIKALAQQRSASVRIGSARHPYALGAEFGGGKRPTTRQFPPFNKSGRFLYPTIAKKSEEVVEAYGKAVDHLMRKAFPS